MGSEPESHVSSEIERIQVTRLRVGGSSRLGVGPVLSTDTVVSHCMPGHCVGCEWCSREAKHSTKQVTFSR